MRCSTDNMVLCYKCDWDTHDSSRLFIFIMLRYSICIYYDVVKGLLIEVIWNPLETTNLTLFFLYIYIKS